MPDIVSTGVQSAQMSGERGVVYTFDYSILPQYAAWAAETAYTAGDRVSRSGTGRIYQNLISGTDATNPEDALSGETPKWSDIGPIAQPVYLTPDLEFYKFSGNASLHLVQTAGQITVQLQSDNSGNDASYIAGHNTSGTQHPAICTDLTFSGTPNKFFEGISIPPAKRNRIKFSNSHATATATGKAYLYISKGV
ncbi:MAG: hypothetical protein HGB35_00075 [Geobacteraceae bacterium]|nr:hypothetical protein [Geobacteraceae bacterium]